VKKVDCRLCKNLIDTEKGCKHYGSNPDEAVKKCAGDNFRNYHLKLDKQTKEWFKAHVGEESTVVKCDKCGWFYKPELGHTCREEKA